jgi:hypothetical protein
MIVTFGKYKGQSAELLKNDKSYCDWLIKQDWFISNNKYVKLYKLITDPMYVEPSKNVYKFGNNTFKSKTEAEIYIRQLISSIGVCNSVKNISNDKFNQLLSILQCHPNSEKVSNINDILIIKNKLNTSAFELNILNNDGTIDDISWKICISGIHKTHKTELLSALRYSIDEQIYEYKKNVSLDMCSLCLEYCHNNGGIHVDHVIHFEKLVEDFNSTCGINIPNIFDNASDGSNRRAFKDDDSEYMNAWLEFHKNNAILRILCRACNLKREKYKADTD